MGAVGGLTTLNLAWLIVSVSTWLTPLPAHAQGRIVYYGPQALIQANADWHGYDLAPYRERCGLAVMSPADLGKIVWVRLPGGRGWYGPCLAVDVAQRVHFYQYVEVYGEVVEVGDRLRGKLQMGKGWHASTFGEVAVGACPPGIDSRPENYRLEVEADLPPLEITPSFYPYPPQEWPGRCEEEDRNTWQQGSR